MVQNYDMQRAREGGREAGKEQASARQGGSIFTSNSALTAALGGETPPDPGLGSRMAARMTATFGQAAGGSAGMGVVQMKPIGEPDRGTPVTGSLAAIRSMLEQKSSVSLRDVNVHYNSSKPAEIGALAYAKGTDVFMGPGQEKYLGHELTHVVQQKQGMVRSTGSVGGMPVNTSPALENAADHMQVSAAPAVAAAPVPGGVVQGVFKDANGRELNKKDVEAMVSMMDGSLEGHQALVDEALPSAKNPIEESASTKNMRRLQKAYQGNRKSLRKRYMKMMKSKKTFSPEEVLGSEVSEAQYKGKKKGFDMFNNISLRLQSSLFTSGTDFARKVGKAVHEKKDTREGYEESQKGFTLADKAMEGVHDIADYDPELADYGVLTKGRMGNSNSYDLDPNSQAYQKKKGEFEDAAEAARQGAVSMRKSTEDIGFGDLYSVFSEINKRTQAGNADGGKLRGEGAGSQSEGISGVSSGVLGEDTFRTLSTIASKMNEIKKVKDRDLQKTQAIQLAAYAYQMSISEHVFRDGNGRSCRLLADTVLQTFGLPPHTPLDEESKIGGSIGNKMDFDKGAQVFLGGVKSSDAKMKSEGKVPPKAPVVPGKQAAEAAAPIKDMGKQDKKKKSWKFWKR